MRISERTFGLMYYGYRRYSANFRVEADGHTLVVENRDLYTSYRLEDYYGREILRHDVRTPEPLPIRPAQIIHARHIPWFMWLYYAIRDWRRQRLSDRELDEWLEKDLARRAAVRQAVKERGLGRFGGRYNR